ncbi:MAG: hypothetical protein KBT36_05005 [Kurthia sp.]|nr:hypothetical protein [Candidatus Kurthia equi]
MKKALVVTTISIVFMMIIVFAISMTKDEQPAKNNNEPPNYEPEVQEDHIKAIIK